MHSCGSLWHDWPYFLAASAPFLGVFATRVRAWWHARQGCKASCGHGRGR